MPESRVAIIGATGAVGRTMLEILEARDLPLAGLRLMASARSAGRTITTRWGEVTVEDLASADPNGIDVALFSAGASRSRQYAPAFAQAGATVVDNSSAFRMDPKVPLVVAGVNDHAVGQHRGIIANPNCTTMTLMMAAGPLHRRFGLSSVAATSYQSVSGAGMTGMDTLWQQTEVLREQRDALVEGGWEDQECGPFQRTISFNVVPLAGAMGESGHTDEEWKLVNESRKILERDDILVEPTCVRVPVMVGHGIAASMWFDTPVDVSAARVVLAEASGIEVWSDERVATPLDSAGRDVVMASRLRPTIGRSGGISLWVVGDNLRKGAALNAVQIAELLA